MIRQLPSSFGLTIQEYMAALSAMKEIISAQNQLIETLKAENAALKTVQNSLKTG